MTDARAPFGDILRRFRKQAGLSQEELAEKAGLSADGISALERGIRQQPYPATLRRLADALGLADHERTDFLTQSHSPKTTPSTTPPGILPFPTRGFRAPPDRAAALPLARHNLPVEVTPFVGRQQELADVTSVLAGRAAGPRLLTLTGAGGCGKTRLALRAARDLAPSFQHGVWLVELAPLGDSDLVTTTVANVLGIRGNAEQTQLEALLLFLQDRQILLVLDNCEHLVGTVAALATAILRSCPTVHILATSRELLRIDGEETFRVPSLALPTENERQSPNTLAEVESIHLFLDRARMVQPGFALNDQNAPFVAEICRRLDGIPLAIELAAMRVKVLGVEQIAQRLDQRFALLTSGKRAALPRQQTLAAAVAWSYDLLSEPEQRLFEALSVFAGSFSLEAAEAVGGDEGVGVLSVLADLVDKSLVVAEPRGSEYRYHLLETIRRYAAEKLVVAGGVVAARDRHRDFFLLLAQRAEPELEGPDVVAWLELLDCEADNLRTALDWCSGADAARGLRLAGAIYRFWRYRGRFSEGRHWLQLFLTATPAAEQDRRDRAWALTGLGELAVEQGARREAVACLEEAVGLLRETDASHELAVALHDLSFLYLDDADDVQRAQQAARESLVAARRADNQRDIGTSFEVLGMAAGCAGNLDLARSHFEEALPILRAVGDPFAIATLLWYVGQLALARGDEPMARRHLEEARELARALTSDVHHALIVLGLAWLARSDGNAALAHELLRQGVLPLVQPASGNLADALVIAGLIAMLDGDLERGVRLLGAATKYRPAGTRVLTIDVDMFGAIATAHDRLVVEARAALGEENFARAWAAGATMTPEQAVYDASAEVR